MKNILIWCIGISQHFFAIAVSNFMRCLVMFITAVCLIFLLKLKWPKNKSVSLPSVCHILSGCRKTFGVNYGQSLEMGPQWSILGIRGHFSAIFASRVITFFFLIYCLRMLLISKND